MDYAKLAEQYGSFLIAIGGVSITVLTVVLSIWFLQSKSDGQNGSDQGALEIVSNRTAIIESLIIATFCSFVGAHLMAETSAFLAHSEKGFGARQFLIASVNIFICVTVVMFAVLLLATEYRKKDPNAAGLRRMSLFVFDVVVFCVLWWMLLSILSRMPPPDRRFAVLPFAAIIVIGILASLIGWKAIKKTVHRYLVPVAFIIIVLFTLASLVLSSHSLSASSGVQVGNGDALLFVSAITFACSALLISAYAMVGKAKQDVLFAMKT